MLARRGAVLAAAGLVWAVACPAPGHADETPLFRITVDDGTGEVRRDADTSYVITVHNDGYYDYTEAVITQTLAPGLRFTGADPRPSDRGDGRLVWRTRLPARTAVVLTIGARVALPADAAAERPRLSATACVEPTPDDEIIACATDYDTALPAEENSASGTAAGLGAVALAAAGVAFALRRRGRRSGSG